MSATKIDTLYLRFNKRYNKLEGVGNSATLLYSGFISLENPDMVDFYHYLLEYDMKVGDLTTLPTYGQYIICIFRDDASGKIFTTMRTSTEEHISKYFGNVGKSFEVIFNAK